MSKRASRGLKLCQTLKPKPGIGATGREVAPFAMRSRYPRTLGRSRAQDANSGRWVNHKTWSQRGVNLYRRASFGARKAAVIRSRGVGAKQGFIMYYTKGVATGPRSVSAIGRVVAYQGWSLRGVPLYSYSSGHSQN